MGSEVLILGDANLDILGCIRKLPELGKCEFGKTPAMQPGGSGLNTAAACKRLGLQPSFFTKLGSDRFGDILLEMIEDLELDTSLIRRTREYPTGVVVVPIVDGERSFLSFRELAADLHVNQEDIESLDMKARSVFLCGTAVFEAAESFDTYMEVIREIKSSGGRVFFDPNIRKEHEAMEDRLQKLMPLIDVFLPSEKELEYLQERFPSVFDTASLIKDGVSEIWIKKGKEGCEFLTKHNHITIPAFNACVLDTTGAGDAFDACIIWGHINSKNSIDSGILANTFAGMSIERLGAADSYPELAEVLESPGYSAVKRGVRIIWQESSC